MFFIVGPWGDAFIALEPILSAILAWALYPSFRKPSPRWSRFGLIAAGLGALVVTTGSVLVISAATDYVLAGHYTSFGFALTGMWLLALKYLARKNADWHLHLV